MWTLALAAICGALVLLLRRRQRRPRPLRGLVGRRVQVVLCEDAHGNEALVLDARLGDARTLFHLDTGYAGPPVLSTSYLAVQRREPETLSVRDRYARSARLLAAPASDDARERAVGTLLRSGLCRSFTSGCTMRLMGIGVTAEMQADMLLCPALALSDGAPAAGEVNADVFVTNPLRGSIHILTCDFLLHRAPAVLCPAAGALWLAPAATDRRALERGFRFHDAFFVGGAFALPMRVGGTELRIVVDTGAAAALSLGRSAAERLRTCRSPAEGAYHLVQSGVNGERICSAAVTVAVVAGGVDLGEVDALVNEDDVEGADGYAGLGLLRALDLWMEPHRIGVRRNTLPVRTTSARSPGGCSGVAPPACAGDAAETAD